MTALSQIEWSRTLPDGRVSGAEPTRVTAKVILAAVLLALSLCVPMLAYAAGTAAGTAISNTATLDCDVCGAGGKTASTTPFLVDAKVNLTVSGGSNADVSPGTTAQLSTFTVTNNANSPLDFSLAISQVATPTDQFDATACVAYVENGSNPGYQSAEDTATYIDELAADTSATVYAVCDIPTLVSNANIAMLDLAANALGDFSGLNRRYVATPGTQAAAISQSLLANDAGAVDIAFADIAGTATGDLARDARHSARNTYTILASAVVTLTKIVTRIEDTTGCVASVCSILSGDLYQCETASRAMCKVTTGTAVTFRVDYVVSGGGSVNDVVLTDPIVDGMTYVADSLTVNGVAKTDAADSDNAAFCSAITASAPCNVPATNTITVIPGNVTAPTSLWFSFRATIN